MDGGKNITNDGERSNLRFKVADSACNVCLGSSADADIVDEVDKTDSESSSAEDSPASGSEDEGEDGQDPEDAAGESGYPEAGQTSGLDEGTLSADELFVTDENGQILVEYLDADSTYVIREIKTIPGYNLSHELVSFSVDSEGLIDGSFIKEVTMKLVIIKDQLLRKVKKFTKEKSLLMDLLLIREKLL